MNDTASTLKDAIRTIPDYPKAGIQFRDITTLLGNAQAFRRAVDEYLKRERPAVEQEIEGLMLSSPFKKENEQ